MAPPTSKSKGKGKSKDQSTDWSDWQRDKDGNYFRSRYNSNGIQERYYEQATSNAALQDERIPRTTGLPSPSEPQQPIYSVATANPLVVSGASGYSSSGHSYYTTAPAGTTTYGTSSNYYTNAAQASNIPQDYQSGYGSNSSYYNNSYATTSPISGDDLSYVPNPAGSSTLKFGFSGRTDYFPNSTNPEASSSKARYSGYMGESVESVTQSMQNTAVKEQYTFQNESQTLKRNDRSERHNKSENLNDKYRSIPEKEQKRFWRQGRVFMMLWTEPAASDQKAPTEGPAGNASQISTTWLNGTAYSEIRRFVVIREGWGNNICCPVHTYSGKATLKPGLSAPQQHAIIYTSSEPPPEHAITGADGQVYKEQLTKLPIRVKREERGPEGDLGTLSRLNYSKIYTVENYAKVLNIGMVHKDSLPALDANCILKPQEKFGERPREDLKKHSSGGGHKQHRSSRDRK